MLTRWIRRESAKRRHDRDISKKITRAVIAAVNGMNPTQPDSGSAGKE